VRDVLLELVVAWTSSIVQLDDDEAKTSHHDDERLLLLLLLLLWNEWRTLVVAKLNA
jgi:hypothetical protein